MGRDRAEDFVATFSEHAQTFEVEVGADPDGRMTALRVCMLHDLGAYSPYGFAVCQNTADHVVGPYAIPQRGFQLPGGLHEQDAIGRTPRRSG